MTKTKYKELFENTQLHYPVAHKGNDGTRYREIQQNIHDTQKSLRDLQAKLEELNKAKRKIDDMVNEKLRQFDEATHTALEESQLIEFDSSTYEWENTVKRASAHGKMALTNPNSKESEVLKILVKSGRREYVDIALQYGTGEVLALAQNMDRQLLALEREEEERLRKVSETNRNLVGSSDPLFVGPVLPDEESEFQFGESLEDALDEVLEGKIIEEIEKSTEDQQRGIDLANLIKDNAMQEVFGNIIEKYKTGNSDVDDAMKQFKGFFNVTLPEGYKMKGPSKEFFTINKANLSKKLKDVGLEVLDDAKMGALLGVFEEGRDLLTNSNDFESLNTNMENFVGGLIAESAKGALVAGIVSGVFAGLSVTPAGIVVIGSMLAVSIIIDYLDQSFGFKDKIKNAVRYINQTVKDFLLPDYHDNPEFYLPFHNKFIPPYNFNNS